MRFDAVILGGGAAGLFCGLEAARRGRRVLVLEHNARPGEKIRISGGGRCNFTNTGIAAEAYLGANPRFALSALKRFTQWDFLTRIEAAGIAWHEKTRGQLFCDGPATQVVAMLCEGLAAAGGTLWTGTSFGAVTRTDDGFAVETSRGVASAARVVVATGGKSIPKMGATDAGYRLAAAFGLPLVPTRPGLVALTFGERDLEWMRPLAGLAVEGRVSSAGRSFDEAVLFTHRGLSGPAVLQASSYWREGAEITVDLARDADAGAALRSLRAQSGRIGVARALASLLPERLARHLAEGIAGTLGDQSNAALDRLAARVHALALRPLGTEGYRTAEVTLGGVSTDALDPRTMEARAVPGLHFAGEVVDVTGWLGGYNFQWAWSSGWVAAQAL